MKKIVFMAVSLLLVTMLHAQRQGGTPPTAEESAKRQTEWMKNELKLTNKQVISKVDSINLVFAKKQSALFQNNGGDREKRREEFRKLNEEKTKALSQILNKEQQEAYKKALSQQQQNRGNRGNGGGGNRGNGGNGGGNGNGGGRRN